MRITEAAQPGDLDAAALIWAEATATRDGAEAASLAEARLVIDAVLRRSPDAFVLIAWSGDGTASGFAAAGPVPAGAGRAELAYFGVRPADWGTGVGERLLGELGARFRAAGYRRAQLLVYADNARAIALYVRLGWRPAGLPAAHPRTGKPEQRYELEL